jgi:hypothetical protein
MWQEDLVNDLNSADHGNKGALLASWSERTGMSRRALYRAAAEFGYSSGRNKRSDAGTLRCGLTDGQIELVAALVYETRREVKGPIMPVERALEIAVDSGYIEPGQVSVSRMQQLLREREINAAALKEDSPAQPMRSLHPNHVHVVDASVCVQYYLRGKAGMRIMDEREFYKNKLHKFANIKLRLLRYVITDHFSGAFWVRYFNTTGETQQNIYDTLVEAWSPKADPRMPFRGVPYILLMDAGSANTARGMTSFLDRLGVEVPKGMPHNSRRQGSAEVTHNIWEMWFESGLRLDPAQTIEDLNAKAVDMAIHLNGNKKHTRHGMTRTEAWLLITPEHLRELPSRDILQELLIYTGSDLTRRVSREYSISYRAREWSVRHIPAIVPGRSTVQVVVRPYTPDVIAAEFNGAVYDLTEIKTLASSEGGFRADSAVIGAGYKSPPDTVTIKAEKRFDRMAFGEEKKKDAVPFEGLTVFGNHADKVDLTYVPKKGAPIEIDRSIVRRQIPMGEFLKSLVGRCGPISRDLNADLRRRYGGSIDVTDADRVSAEIEEGTYARGDGADLASARRA